MVSARKGVCTETKTLKAQFVNLDITARSSEFMSRYLLVIQFQHICTCMLHACVRAGLCAHISYTHLNTYTHERMRHYLECSSTTNYKRPTREFTHKPFKRSIDGYTHERMRHYLGCNSTTHYTHTSVHCPEVEDLKKLKRFDHPINLVAKHQIIRGKDPHH